MPRWLKIFLWLLAVPFLAAVTLPWWMPLAARPILKIWDITFENYERVGYSRFRMDELRFARNSTTVVAHSVEANSPLFWLRPAARHVTVKDWLVDVRKSTAPSPTPSKIVGMPSLQTLLLKISRALDRWLHTAEIGPGEVRWPNGGLTLQKAEWSNDTLTAHGVNFLKQTGDVVVTTSNADKLISGTVKFANEDATLKATWTGGTIKGDGVVWSQPLQLHANFPAQGWIPEDAGAIAANWNLPAERVRLAAQYTRVTGNGSFTWKDNAFTLALDAKAAPKADVKAPELAGHVEASGNREAATITALQIDAPFAKARLSAPVVIGFDGQPRGAAAKLSLDADLAKQPWIEAKGRVEGSATVSRVDAPLEFQLELSKIIIGDFTIDHATTRGRWLWPKLELTQLDAQLDKTSRVRASGSVDWQARQLTGVSLTASLTRDWFARWLPENTTWQKMEATAKADGALDAPRHSGTLAVTQADMRVIKPFSLTGAWNGIGKALEKISVEAQAGTTKITLAGSGDHNGLDVRELTLAPINAEALSLSQPARIDWTGGFKLSHLALQNTRSTFALDFTAGDQMSFKLAAANFDKEWLGQWLDIPGPTWIVANVEASGITVKNILEFSLALCGEIRAPQQIAQVTLAATGNANGIAITDLKFTDKDRVLTQVTGRLPVTWSAQRTPHLQLSNTAPLELQAEALADSPLWPAVSEPAGLSLTGAIAHAQLKGTLKQPQGNLEIDVASLKVTANSKLKENLPDIENFTLRASAAREFIKIDAISAKLEGQSLQASGLLPMDDGRWRELLSKPADFNWDDAEALVEIPGADLAPLARRLPDFVAAQGQLKARVELSKGGNFSGSLELINAGTRPIPALGTVQEINATLGFAGREAKIESFSAKLGGEPVKLSGTVLLPLRGDPQVALKLSGKNLPLVRRAGLLLRSDLDLQANTNATGETRVSGLVTLRDGLVLSDLSALLPSGTRAVTRRPPYFAVEKAPFSRWPLAVEVRGKNAIRLRTPLFIGTASAHFDLTGTLGEPRAIGEVTIDQGQLFFPFATFTVQTGAVRLRASDPYSPQIGVNAISRRHNYELRLEVSGSPEAPALQFSSNPPLEASQVLLMVMAGQIPADETAGTTAQGGVRLGQLGAYLGQGIYRGLGGTSENRLEIVSGEQVSRQGRETYEVAYKLGEKWTLVGEYDEFDAYNAGLKWRFYTQEGAREKK